MDHYVWRADNIESTPSNSSNGRRETYGQGEKGRKEERKEKR